ncbi:MAG: general secretion pathway protein GspL [Ideonella sp.]|nr:general secretion pathway protein GspL [Ideonella sp.]
MSTLVIPLAARSRLRARSPGGAEPDSARTQREYAFVLSTDGLAVASHGECAAALLPRADNVALVLDDSDVSWHRIELPRAPPAKLRAALAGVLEDALLEDTEGVHFAVAPDARPGEPAWIAAVDKPWLQAELAALERSNVFVDRVLPLSWPDDPPCGHFTEDDAAAGGSLRLNWAHANGVASLRLQGSLARELLTQPLPPGTRLSATPAAAAAAEQWLDAPVSVQSHAERALDATRSLWNLRQFDLARRSRGFRALRDTLRRLQTPAWRPLRIGVVALAATQIVGLNAWAWHLRATLADRRAAEVALLQSTFPQVRAVLDAPVQMRREVAQLRAAAGKPYEGDLEPLLQAAASAWPPAQAAVEQLRFEPGRLTLTASNWSPEQIEQFRTQLRPQGLQVESAEGRLVLSRARGAGGTS